MATEHCKHDRGGRTRASGDTNDEEAVGGWHGVDNQKQTPTWKRAIGRGSAHHGDHVSIESMATGVSTQGVAWLNKLLQGAGPVAPPRLPFSRVIVGLSNLYSGAASPVFHPPRRGRSG